MANVPTIKLNNGVSIPVLGLGTFQGLPEKAARAGQAVRDAIDVGYRHIDCAHAYGNEDVIGDAIAEKIADGSVTRAELFVVTKLWNTHHRPEAIEPMLRKQLKSLRLDYVDLYLIHWPQCYKEGDDQHPTDPATGRIIFSNYDLADTWLAMEQVQKKGLARSIGVSNFNSLQVDKVLSRATIAPVVNQVECHPYLNQKRLRDFCKKRRIVTTSYSPLGSPQRPYKKPGDLDVIDDPQVKAIAERYGKSPAQILIRYNVQLGNVAIPKSINKERMQQNIDVFDFSLTEEDMMLIDALDCNGRTCLNAEANEHPLYPFQPHVEF